jgi:DNA-binding CsgD family transcriptional regulator
MIYQAELLARKGLAAPALEVLNEVEKMKNQLLIPHVYYEGKFLKAKLLKEQGMNQHAHLLADTVIKWFKNNKQFALAYTAEREKSGWYLGESNFEQAYQKAIQANQLHDSIMAMIAQEIYDEVALKYENQLLSTKINLMEAEAVINKSQIKIRNVLFLIYSLLLISLILLRLWLRKREKLKNELLVNRSLQLEKENEHKKSQLEKAELERKLKEDELERFLLEAEVREQELVFKSLRQANLVLLNKSIKERLGPFQFKFSRKKDQEAFVEELEALSREAARDPLSDFENMFTQMHSGFYEKLIDLNPEFTRSELQMCALLRMNLPSKEIANVLSLSVSRVDQTRHQIRKKLELDQAQSLTSFLILI